MSITDELRRLLDERGVEWIGTSFSTPTKGHPTNTSLGEEHHEATFIEYDDGNVLRLFDLTPEQAVEATLGRGTCEILGFERVVRCKDCAKWSFFDVEDGWFRCTHFDRPTRRDGFCAWGERRDV